MDIKKLVFIISDIPIADQQGASYARILAYSKALTTDKNIDVYLVSTKYPVRLNETKEKLSGNIYLCGKKNDESGNSTFTKRTTDKIFGKAAFGKFLGNVSDLIDGMKGQKSVLVYPTINNYADELSLLRMIKMKGIPVYSERNELNIGKVLNNPFPKNPVKKILFGLYFPFKILDHYKQDRLVAQYDGNIVISTMLEKKVAGHNTNLIRIPILTEVEKFDTSIKKERRNDLINLGFTGTLNNKKDGIDKLIKAISILNVSYGINNIRLNLYGRGYRDTIAKLKKQISELGLNDIVILHGKVSSNEIPYVLSQQDILILTRPTTLQTRYGFSTKLAEYMASGVSVLATDVSDNALYIKDGVNGFIIKSHKPGVTAKKLNEIISHGKYQDAEIRKNAKETARKYFNGNNYSAELINFLFAKH